MRKKYEQMSLLDTYGSVEERLENNKPALFLLDGFLVLPLGRLSFLFPPAAASALFQLVYFAIAYIDCGKGHGSQPCFANSKPKL